jgi:predicted dehydrogenase
MEHFGDVGAPSSAVGSSAPCTSRTCGVGVDVRGVLGSDHERGQAAATRIGLPRAYASLDELLDDPAVHAVHVTSPNQLHYPQVKAILAAGRHVICEKPMAVTSDESRELVRLAAASDRITAVNFNIRFYPVNQHAHQMVRDGDLGKPRLVTGHYFQDWLLLDTDWNWRLEPDKGGSLRAVGDIGSHWIDLTNFITGCGESVAADLHFVKVRQQPTGPVETFAQERSADTKLTEMHTEDAALILLRYENGARGMVGVSQVSAGRKNSLQWEVDGSESAAWWDSETPDHLYLGHRGRPNEILQRGAELMNPTGVAAASLPGGHVEGFGDTFHALFREVYRAILAGRAPDRPLYATFEDGHHEMVVGDAIAASAREGRWVDVSP